MDWIKILNRTKTINVFDGITIAAGGQKTYTLNLKSNMNNGFCTLQLLVSGDGTLDVTFKYSNNGIVYVKHASNNTVVESFTKTSGPDGDGNGIYELNPLLSKYIMLVFDETSTTDNITIDADLVIQ